MPRRYVAKKPRHDWRTPFLAALAGDATVKHACRVADIDRPHAYRVRSLDGTFAAAWDDAERRAVAARPAIKHPPICRWTDGMLMAYLRRKRPEKYREPRYAPVARPAEPTVEVAARKGETPHRPLEVAEIPAKPARERRKPAASSGRNATKASLKKRRASVPESYIQAFPTSRPVVASSGT